MRANVLVPAALLTGLVLVVPLVAMLLTGAVDWTATDFLAMATLVFGTTSLGLLTARKVRTRPRRWAVGLAFLVLFLWLWAESAVGVLTDWGS